VAIIEKIENRIDKTIWEKQNIIEKVILFCLPYHIAAFFECVDDDFRDGDTFPDNLYDYEEEIHANSEEIITDLLYFFNLEISNAGGGAAAGGDIDLQ
jgi:hypothetical protein